MRGIPLVDYGGTTRTADAGRSAEPHDALRRWALLRGEVSEQSAAYAGAGERLAGNQAGRDDWVAGAGGGDCGCASVAGGAHSGVAVGVVRTAADDHGGAVVWIAVCGGSDGGPGVRLPARGD